MIAWPALIAPVVGPPLGGLIATYASWRWIFLLNMPIGLVGVWLVLRFVPDARGEPRKPLRRAGLRADGAWRWRRWSTA